MRSTVLTLIGGLLVGVSPLSAQPALPKPGPEHEFLKKFEGDWDVTVSMGGTQSKGSASYRITLGGFWLSEHFQGEFGGMKFEGRGTTGYDPLKKKYVTAWTDSMSPSLLIMEGTVAKDGKTFTGTGEAPNMEGKIEKMKTVYDFKDKDSFVFTMYRVADGKDQEEMKLTYKRKK